MHRGWAFLIALALATLTPACFDRACDGSFFWFGGNPGEGEYLSVDEWQSSPPDGDWIEFTPGRVVVLSLGRWATEGRAIVEMHGYVSEQPPAQCSGACDGGFAELAGNPVEFSNATTPGQLWVNNGTCAHYYLRVTLRAGPPTRNADAGPLDAATLQDAALE